MKRKKIKGEKIEDQTIQIDGKRFDNCEFKNCVLIYGGERFEMNGCEAFLNFLQTSSASIKQMVF